MSRPDHARLADIEAAIDRCLAYRAHLDSPDLGAMAYDAVLRNLAVVGEAVRSLPRSFKLDRPEVPWASITGLRNVVVHEYFKVDPELVRDIVDNQLVGLAVVIRTATTAPGEDPEDLRHPPG